MSLQITENYISKRNFLVAAIVVSVLCFWAFLVFGEFFALHSTNAEDRQKLISFRKDLRLGDNYEKVLQNFWSKKTKDSRLSVSVYSSEEWMISMRPEIFATDWRMFVKFEEGKVVGYTVRTSDGPKPSDAPEDIRKVNE